MASASKEGSHRCGHDTGARLQAGIFLHPRVRATEVGLRRLRARSHPGRDELHLQMLPKSPLGEAVTYARAICNLPKQLVAPRRSCTPAYRTSMACRLWPPPPMQPYCPSPSAVPTPSPSASYCANVDGLPTSRNLPPACIAPITPCTRPTSPISWACSKMPSPRSALAEPRTGQRRTARCGVSLLHPQGRTEASHRAAVLTDAGKRSRDKTASGRSSDPVAVESVGNAVGKVDCGDWFCG